MTTSISRHMLHAALCITMWCTAAVVVHAEDWRITLSDETIVAGDVIELVGYDSIQLYDALQIVDGTDTTRVAIASITRIQYRPDASGEVGALIGAGTGAAIIAVMYAGIRPGNG
ncbi:MAG: hypothetical protein H7X80_02320, partial [bacterium]|nr:hypothetical protein [Candidatus Kapabacteria bacterium]